MSTTNFRVEIRRKEKNLEAHYYIKDQLVSKEKFKQLFLKKKEIENLFKRFDSENQ